jgi:hypothetical protein
VLSKLDLSLSVGPCGYLSEEMSLSEWAGTCLFIAYGPVWANAVGGAPGRRSAVPGPARGMRAARYLLLHWPSVQQGEKSFFLSPGVKEFQDYTFTWDSGTDSIITLA